MLGVELDDSRPIVWMIKRMIKAHPTQIGCQGKQDPEREGS
jgi:hypothetical protein